MIVVADKLAYLALEIAGQEVVFQQDAVLQSLMPTLNLALCLWVVGCATDVIHTIAVQPFSYFGRDVGRAIVRQ